MEKTSKIRYQNYHGGQNDRIVQLFKDTFSHSEGASEGIVIATLAHKLLESPKADDIRGFVAEKNGNIIGAIIFSALRFSDARYDKGLLLGPVAVHPEHQHMGYGKKLISEAHQMLRMAGEEWLFTYGDPNFYAKLGYHQITENQVKAPFVLTYPEGWMMQSLQGLELPQIEGNTFCVPAISDPKYW